MTRNSDTSLNTMYFIPDTLTLSNIKNNIDVSSIEDVKYLKDKLIDSLGIPKSSITSSEDSGQVSDFRTLPLDEIDSISAKRIPYIQNALLSGWEKLITLLAYYFGADMDTLKVQVLIKSPSKISSKLTKDYMDGFEFARNSIALLRDIDPDYKSSFNDYKHLLRNIGLNPEVLNVPDFIKKSSSSGMDLGVPQEGTEDPDFGGTEDIGTQPSNSGAQNESLNKIKTSYLKESLPRKSNYPVQIDEDSFVHPRVYDCFVHY